MNEDTVKIIQFYDARVGRKNETILYDVVKKLFVFFIIFLIIGSIIFKEFLLKKSSVIVWACVVIVVAYLMTKGGREKKTCLFQKMVITGPVEEWHYKYDKNGTVQDQTCYHKMYDGMIKFYTLFDTEHDFKKIIEQYTPLTVREVNE